MKNVIKSGYVGHYAQYAYYVDVNNVGIKKP
jgi:hypothetical protein